MRSSPRAYPHRLGVGRTDNGHNWTRTSDPHDVNVVL